jgi:CelD/BcsL family acetyltransferase involved in cellulose biosynthesis
LEFLGTREVASDYLNIIVDPASGCTVLAALVEYLVAHHAEWDVLSLADVDEKAWTLSVIRTLFQTRGFDAVTSMASTHPCPYARLDGGWQAYLQSRSSNFRWQLKRKRDRLVEQHGARFETIDRAEELPRALETLIALHRGRRATLGGTTALEDGSVVAFLRAATPLLQERKWLRLCALVAGGRSRAMLFGLVYRDTFYFYQSGWDVDWSAWAPGMVLHGWCIQHACAEGLSEYDFLRGEESYKARWASYVRRTTRLDIVQRTPRTMIYRGARGLVRGLREARQRLRGAIGGP